MLTSDSKFRTLCCSAASMWHLNYFWKKLLSHVHCPWYKWWKESIYQLFSRPKLLQSDVKCKTQKRQDIKNWCLFVALTQFIFLLLYFLCAYVGKTGNVTISLQVSRLVLPVSLPYHTPFCKFILTWQIVTIW